MPDLIDIDEARRLVLAEAKPLDSESVALDSALDRVLAERVTGEDDLPPLDSSAMDGFARRAGPAARLHVVGDGWHAVPAPRQASHVLTSMLGADGLALVPPGEGELAAGDRVQVELLGLTGSPVPRVG